MIAVLVQTVYCKREFRGQIIFGTKEYKYVPLAEYEGVMERTDYRVYSRKKQNFFM
jgi:hypothetical protein